MPEKDFILLFARETEAIVHGFAGVVGVNSVVVLTGLEKTLNNNIKLPAYSPFSDGKAAVRIIDIVVSRLET